MRCRVCGLELDARDRLPNGAYQCPECGAIHHTASSSKLSPSPWRRKRKRGLPAVLDALSQRRFGLPLWGWLAIALVAIVALIVLLAFGGKGAPEGAATSPTQETTALDVTVEPEAPQESVAPDALPDAQAGAANSEIPATHTGVAQNDFVVSFDWAMSYLGYNASLTASGAATGNVQAYTFQDWLELSLTLGADGSTICSASVTAQLVEGSADTTPVLAAFVSTLYGFDNTTNAGTARTEIESMITDPTRAYDANAFSAKLTTGSFSGYTLDVTGKLS